MRGIRLRRPIRACRTCRACRACRTCRTCRTAAGRTLLLLAGLIVLSATPALAQRATFPQVPPPGVFHVDEAGLLRPAEAAEIDRVAGTLLAEHDVPIIVVTLQRLADHNAAGYTIERYAAELFDHWGIGSQARNYGILLLIAAGDRTARIELGAAYAGRYDAAARYVMDELILPEFRGDRYPEGILAGVRGLDAMARGLPLPAPPLPRYALPLVIGVFVATTALAFSLLNSGKRGWGWALLAMLAALLLWLLSRMGRAGGGTGSGGGGGAFRGGSSGGGGATGRW
jgi:uncharacterized protein